MNEQIINEYLNGKSIMQLSKDYPSISYRQIQKMLKENHIPIRGGRKPREFSEEELSLIKKRYEEEGVSYANIAKELKASVETIQRVISENNFKRTFNNLRKVNRYLKDDYFSVIDAPEKAYWLGFLFTDGNVDNLKQKRIRLQLQEADEEILIKYKEDLGIGGKIIRDERPNSVCLSVEFTSSQIFDDLEKYGIVPRKTYKTEHLPLSLIPEEYQTSFLLGMFDGDGCITHGKNCSEVTIGLTSYYESIVTEFRDAVDKLIDKTDHNKVFFTSAWHVNWRGRQQVIKIMEKLYEKCPRHLLRKYKKFLEVKESVS